MYKSRREKLLNNLEKNSILLAFSGEAKHKSADQYFPYFSERNFNYLTGLNRPNFIYLGVNPNLEYLFIEKNDEELARWIGDKLSKEEASKISDIPLNNILYLEDFTDFLDNKIFGYRKTLGNISNVYLDLDKTSNCLNYAKTLKDKYLFINLKNSNNLIADLRTIKDESEINNIKKAINITNLALQNVLKNIKPNKYEYELEADYNYILNLNNVEVSFKTIAAGGKRGTILHYEDNNQKVLDNELVLFDLGVYYNNYASDISRTYPVSGKFTERQKQFYEIVLKANKETIKNVKPGWTFKQFHQFGKDILIDGLKKLGKIKSDDEITKYYFHSLGHYLGLDVHDVGNYDRVIEEGMVITVEPGLYISDESIGIRIEDDILITKDGCINLSESIIKEIDDIETYINKNRK